VTPAEDEYEIADDDSNNQLYAHTGNPVYTLLEMAECVKLGRVVPWWCEPVVCRWPKATQRHARRRQHAQEDGPRPALAAGLQA
jgi:hypothetical protein